MGARTGEKTDFFFQIVKRATGAKKKRNDATISGEELSEITGFTDRHHRDLAKKGYFAPPVRGVWQREETLLGLIRYFRERAGAGKDAEKKARAAYWEVKREREEFEFRKLKGEFVQVDQLQPALRNVCLQLSATLRRKLESELPSRLGNKTEAEMREEMKASVDELFGVFRAGVSAWVGKG